MRVLITTILLISSLLAGCTGDNPQRPEETTVNQTGQLEVVIRMGKLAQATIARAEAIVTASDMSTITRALTIDGSTLSGFLEAIPAGQNRLFTLNAYDSSNQLIYTGSSTSNVDPGSQTTLRITMRKVTTELTNPPDFTFQGNGNGTTGLFDLERGVYIATLSKNSNVFVDAELIDGKTGSEVRFDFSSLLSVAGFNQSKLSKSFMVDSNGQYLININSTSGLKGWSLDITKSDTTIIENGTPAQFSGNGNGTTGIVSLTSGVHLITITKDTSSFVDAELFDADTGEEIRFDLS